MRDKRPVDELSIEELERILALRKREARMARLRNYEGSGRLVGPLGNDETRIAKVEPDLPPPLPQPVDPPTPAVPPVYFENEPQFEDELDAKQKPRRVTSTRPRVMVWNRLLLLVEIAAVFGLVALVVGLFQTLQAATQASSEITSQAQATARAGLVPPTSTPVINVAALVLPVGHTVTISDNGAVVSAAFNLDEIPAQYRAQFIAQMSEPTIQPTISPEGPVRIQIPRIKVDATVVSGDSWEVLQLGVGHHLGSANPGERGNMVLSAHDDVYGEIFRELDKLKGGDLVTVSTTKREFTYVVQDTKIVMPTDVWVLEARDNTRQLTLISCYPYRVDTRRIVVFATLQSPS